MASKRKSDGAGPSNAKEKRAEAELAVIGIDFGTRGTGYAYAFTDKPETVVPKQPGGHHDDQKALTCVLLDEAGHFKAFGVEAQRVFADADTENGAQLAACGAHVFVRG